METVTIPGGEAVLLNDPSELTPRRRRPIEIISTRVGRKLEAMTTATRLVCEGAVLVDHSEELNDAGEQVFPGGDVEISEKEFELVGRLNDVIALALLKSWTIDHPLPTCEQDFLDIPIDVYDSLRAHAARINAEVNDKGDGFSVDQVEDAASPTGG